MSKNKQSQGRYDWTLNAVKALMPMVRNKECISRRRAIKLVNPATEWERRELEKLRARANKVIANENIDILHYTVFGCASDHPSMKGVTAEFMKNLPAAEASFNPTTPPALPAEPVQAIKIECVSQEEAYRREPKDGLAYSNSDGMFVCIEGKFHHMGNLSGPLGGPDPRAVAVRAMSEAELLAAHLGCELTMVGTLENIKDLPKGARIGDFCMYGNKLLAWNGKEWIFGTTPFNPVPKTAVNLKVNHDNPAAAQPKLTWFERVKRAIGFK